MDQDYFSGYQDAIEDVQKEAAGPIAATRMARRLTKANVISGRNIPIGFRDVQRELKQWSHSKRKKMTKAVMGLKKSMPHYEQQANWMGREFTPMKKIMRQKYRK